MEESGNAMAKDSLALHYHLLETMIGTPAEPPVEEFFVAESLARLKKQLKASPFKNAAVRRALRTMAEEGLVARHRRGRRFYYRVADTGIRAYNRYKEVMILWRLEKKFGRRLTLETVTRISLRKKGQDKLYMPRICFIHQPFSYELRRHRFEADREICIYEVLQRSNKL